MQRINLMENLVVIDNYLSVALDDLESYISNNSSQKTKNSKS